MTNEHCSLSDALIDALKICSVQFMIFIRSYCVDNKPVLHHQVVYLHKCVLIFKRVHFVMVMPGIQSTPASLIHENKNILV